MTPETSTPAAAPAGIGTKEKAEHLKSQAYEIVRRDSLWAMGVGLIPVPGLDLIGVTAVQIKMLRSLSELYSIPFTESRAKSIIGALASGLGSLAGFGLVDSVVKIIPIIGQTAGIISMPVSAGAFTYATGRVFVQHFASGGTFLDFDPIKVRDFFRKEFEAAKVTVQNLQASSKS